MQDCAINFSMVKKSGHLSDLKGWSRCLNNLWGKPGALRKISIEMLDYFRPGFHPWQNDNRHLLKDIDALEKSVHAIYEKAAA